MSSVGTEPAPRSAAPPLIAVTGRRRSAAGAHDGPSALDRLEVEVYFSGYADRLAAAGAVPVHLASRVDPPAAMARVDGLVLTGGTDVDPTLYGDHVRETTPPLDPPRDRFEAQLLTEALERGLPVLAICRGLQLLNVTLGGTLHPHLTDHPLGFDGAHEVTLTAGSVAAGIYGRSTAVNSLHHQAVAALGDGLVATGWSPDGTVEVMEAREHRILAVQWHPEQLARPDPAFAWLVEAARDASPHAVARHDVP